MDVETSAEPTPRPTACESCGSPEAAIDLVAVRRVYVTPEAWDTPGKVEVVDEVEVWCFPCRSMYPHEPVG